MAAENARREPNPAQGVPRRNPEERAGTQPVRRVHHDLRGGAHLFTQSEEVQVAVRNRR